MSQSRLGTHNGWLYVISNASNKTVLYFKHPLLDKLAYTMADKSLEAEVEV